MTASLFDFTDEEIFAAAKADRLLSIEVEFSRVCNYRCPYCYVGEDASATTDELTAEEIDSVVSQAAKLGARKVVVLGGEPLLYPDLEARLAHIAALGMRPEIFTNASLLDRETAEMLDRYHCRVVVKLNSLNPEVQRQMTGVPNAFAKAMHAIALLRDYGFAASGRLAASSVICTTNYDSLYDLWRHCRENDIIPYLEMLTPQGRMHANRHLFVTPRDTFELFQRIRDYDRARAIDWPLQPPLVGGKCLRHLYSCLVNASGEVMPCVGVTIPLGNVRDKELAKILGGSMVMHDFKNFRTMIKAPCKTCDNADTCYGCRGAAYQLTGDYLAADPMCWKNCESNCGKNTRAKGEETINSTLPSSPTPPDAPSGAPTHPAIKTLPQDATDLLPHKPPIRMVDTLLKVGRYSEVSARIRPANPFLNAHGILENAALVELAAQAVAVADTFRHDGIMKRGFLVGASDFTFTGEARIGDELIVKSEETEQFDEWHIIGTEIFKNGTLIASGSLKLVASSPPSP